MKNFNTIGCVSVISRMIAKNLVFSMELFCLFNEATRKDTFSKKSLPFLNSSEIFLFMIFSYNILCAVLKHQYNAPMVAVML